MSGHLSDLAIDRLLAGELDGAAGEATRAHLAGCADCEARRSALARESEAFPQEIWIAGEAAKVRRAVARPARRRWAVGAALAAAASIAAIAVLMPPEDDWTGIKGGRVSLQLHALRAGATRSEKLLPGAELAAGDAVQFEVVTREGGTLWILGIDGAGKVSVYAKEDPAPARPEPRVLHGSVRLDAAPTAERFFAVLCARGAPSPEPAARTALAGAGPAAVTSLGSGCHEASFLVLKKESR